ncbi:MAG: hypothetical protein CL930_13730 [Deltaproteobacteria bacterium]|nr:hypothetical protein [Deltaproteobacteria bacterium]
MPSRRHLLEMLGSGAVAAMLVKKAGWSNAHADSTDGNHRKTHTPWWLLTPLTVGSGLQSGWFVKDLGPVSNGASVLTLSHMAGQSVQIHICLHSDQPKGYAYTDLFDLIVMDRGHGIRPVAENLSPSLKTLETIIRDNEHGEVTFESERAIGHMMTHAERVKAFGSGGLG